MEYQYCIFPLFLYYFQTIGKLDWNCVKGLGTLYSNSIFQSRKILWKQSSSSNGYERKSSKRRVENSLETIQYCRGTQLRIASSNASLIERQLGRSMGIWLVYSLLFPLTKRPRMEGVQSVLFKLAFSLEAQMTSLKLSYFRPIMQRPRVFLEKGPKVERKRRDQQQDG